MLYHVVTERFPGTSESEVITLENVYLAKKKYASTCCGDDI